jgi:hypothetical protein
MDIGAKQIYNRQTNIQSEVIEKPRATFGGSKMVYGNLQYQFEQYQYIPEY